MEQIIIDFIDNLGLWAVFLLIVLEYACFPIPSEFVLPLAGYFASGGRISFPGMWALSIAAGLIGSTILYTAGYYGGRALLNRVTGKYSGTQKRIRAARAWFDSYGAGSVLVGRVIPLARTYISLVAGTARMRFARFIIFSLLGISLWNLALVGLGYYLGSHWGRVITFYSRYKLILIPTAIVFILYLSLCRFRKPGPKGWN